MLVIIGCLTSYEDFKISKIRNQWVLVGIIYAFSIQLLCFIIYSLLPQDMKISLGGKIFYFISWRFDRWCINLIVSTIVAYMLWHFKMWAAGDAKLFICYSALIPMGKYSKVYFDYYFASFLLLVCIFIPATIFLLIRGVAYISRNKREVIKAATQKIHTANKKESVKTLSVFFVILLFFLVLRIELNSAMQRFIPDQNTIMILLLVLFRPIKKLFRKNGKLLTFAVVILIAYFGFRIESSENQIFLVLSQTLIRCAILMTIIPLFKTLINTYTEKSTQKTTHFAVWMFLGSLIAWFI
ncbi:hypothetical protein ACFL96_06095 [Thermoproteota archaeon]